MPSPLHHQSNCKNSRAGLTIHGRKSSSKFCRHYRNNGSVFHIDFEFPDLISQGSSWFYNYVSDSVRSCITFYINITSYLQKIQKHCGLSREVCLLIMSLTLMVAAPLSTSIVPLIYKKIQKHCGLSIQVVFQERFVC